MWRYMLLLCFSSSMLLAACAANSDEAELFSSEGAIQVNDKNASYRPYEGEELYEDQNPNFLNIGERKTQNAINESQGMLREIVDEDQHFEAGMIYTNGRKAYVHARLNDDYSAEQSTRYKKQLKKKLVEAVPRYEIVLKVRDRK